MIEIAYALGTGAPPQGQQGGGIHFLMMLGLMFVIFYFLLIRPQTKQRRQHEDMLNSLKAGDRIVTTGGLYGKITAIKDQVVTLEIAEKVRVKVVRGNIAGKAQSQERSVEKASS